MPARLSAWPLTAGTDSTASANARIRASLIAASVAIFGAVTAGTAYLGYLLMFTGFTNYDDEGFVLISLRSFFSGQALYDKIVVTYGPFYYEFFGIVHALGVPFDNDSGRLVTLAVWLAIALLAGVSVFIFTRNLGLGLATQLIAFATATLTAEPMHPGGLVSLMIMGIGAVALVTAGRWSGRWPFLIIGVLTAATILTKINVGGFAAISILFACVLTFPFLARNWPIRVVAAAGFIAVPVLLMRTDLDQGWDRFAYHVTLCGLALVLATSSSEPDPDRRPSELGWLIPGGAVLALIVVAVALFRGNSPSDLLNGLILYPTQQRIAYNAVFPVTSGPMLWDAVGLAGAFFWARYRAHGRRQVAIEGVVRVFAGLVIWLTVLGGLHIPGLVEMKALSNPLVVGLALVWVVAAPRATHDGYETLDFARALLPAIAILQSLHSFPVAGSQTAWAALTLVPAGAICIADGLVQLGLTRARLQLASLLVFLTLAVSWLPPIWRDTRAAYASAVSLGLQGATLIRVPPDQAAVLRQVTQSIRDNCETFISVPGLDSFYLFGQVQPPTPLPTRLIWLTDDVPHQQALIAASNRIARLCVVKNDYLITAWSRGRTVTGPLDDYINANFVQMSSIDGYSILTRRS
jgi:hypothetical protein